MRWRRPLADRGRQAASASRGADAGTVSVALARAARGLSGWGRAPWPTSPATLTPARHPVGLASGWTPRLVRISRREVACARASRRAPRTGERPSLPGGITPPGRGDAAAAAGGRRERGGGVRLCRARAGAPDAAGDQPGRGRRRGGGAVRCGVGVQRAGHDRRAQALTVTDAAGHPVGLGRVGTTRGGTTLTGRLTGVLPPGVYKVRWRATGTDGD